MPGRRPLFHYSCSHGADGIRRDGGLIRPNRHPHLPEPLVWLTDLDAPYRLALGLTSHSLSCDRTEHRFAVQSSPACVWWPRYARLHVAPIAREVLESAPGAMPAHWWVSDVELATDVEAMTA